MHIIWNWLLGWVLWTILVALYVMFSFYITGKIPLLSLQRGQLSDDLFYYNDRPKFIPKDAFLLDFHTHTIASDGWMTPRQLILWELANGFNAFVLSDHNTGKNNIPITQLPKHQSTRKNMTEEIIKVMIVDDHILVRDGLNLLVDGYPEIVAELEKGEERGFLDWRLPAGE